MNLFPDSGVFLFVLLFGAVAVAVHSAHMYATGLPRADTNRRSPLLDNIDLRYLSGVKSRNAGMLCYLAINEFIYLILSTSSVILDLSLSVVGGDGTVGAATLDGSGTNSMTPILASSVMLTITQVKPFSQIEEAIRRLSHHVAGIPKTIDEMLTRIHLFRFDTEVLPEQSLTVQEAIELSALARKTATQDLGDNEAEALARSIAKIYILRAWSYGPDGQRLWASANRGALASLVSIVQPRYELFDARLRQLTSMGNAPQGASAGQPRWTELARESSELTDDLVAMFSLLMINQPEVRDPANARQITRLLRYLKSSSRDTEMNALFGAVVLGSPIAFALVALAYTVMLSSADIINTLVESAGPIAVRFGQIGWDQTLIGSLYKAVGFALNDVFGFALIFLVSTSVALTLRATRAAGMQWIHWGRYRWPFQQYLSISVMSALVAALFYCLYVFYDMVIGPSLMLPDKIASITLLRDFRDHIPVFLPAPLSGVLCAWAICLYSDIALDPAYTTITDDSATLAGGGTNRWALLFASLCGLLNGVVQLLNEVVGTIGGLLEAVLVSTMIYYVLFRVYAAVYATLSGYDDGQRWRSQVTQPAGLRLRKQLGDRRRNRESSASVKADQKASS